MRNGPEVRVAESDEEIGACCAVMHELRPHVDAASFVTRVRARERQGGYRLAYLSEGGRPVTVAGFRLLENLAWGRFLYVDDLVSASHARSKGNGAALLTWLRERARARLQCLAPRLRRAAHRCAPLYEREGMSRTSYHFMTKIE